MCQIFYHLCWAGQSRVMIRPKIVGSIPAWAIHWRVRLDDICGSLLTLNSLWLPKFNFSSEHQVKQTNGSLKRGCISFQSGSRCYPCCTLGVRHLLWAEKRRVWGLSEPLLGFFHSPVWTMLPEMVESSREKSLPHGAFIRIACVSVCPEADGGLAMADVMPIPDPQSRGTDLFYLAIWDRTW